MNSWTSGYVEEINYTYGYYEELNPFRLKLAFTYNGLAFPKIETACELGFGFGLSTNIHAATSTVEWWGTDFNPSQAAFAQELAGISGANAQLFDEAFEDFCARKDLPDFDFIGIHGVWSWISQENRNTLISFIRRKLKVGGILYVSYNTLPGWANFEPIRHIMVQHALRSGARGRGVLNNISDAIKFAKNLLDVNPLYLRSNPIVKERLEKLKDYSGSYLAHEYFNQDWYPMHFSTVANYLQDAKLQFACSAHLMDSIDIVNLSPEHQTFLADVQDQILRETSRDFIVNRQFRKDYWVKGLRKIDQIERDRELRELKILLKVTRQDIALKVTGPLGEATLKEEIYCPIIDVLANSSLITIAELEAKLREISFPQIVQSVFVLAALGVVGLGRIPETRILGAVKLLNEYLLDRAYADADISFLASPMTSDGLAVSRIQKLFLLGTQSGLSSVEELSSFAWKWINLNGGSIVKDGKVLSSVDSNLSELRVQAALFISSQLPIFQKLLIC